MEEIEVGVRICLLMSTWHTYVGKIDDGGWRKYTISVRAGSQPLNQDMKIQGRTALYLMIKRNHSYKAFSEVYRRFTKWELSI